MTDVRIFKPSKTAMQSGRNNVKRWVLEFEPGDRNKRITLWDGLGPVTQPPRFDSSSTARKRLWHLPKKMASLPECKTPRRDE